MKSITLKPIVLKILIALLFLLLGLALAFSFIGIVQSRKANEEMNKWQNETRERYRQAVAKKTDANFLVQRGLYQLNSGMIDLSLISLGRATEVQKNYRDAWLSLGLAQFQKGDLKKALDSFQAAERLDPIFAQTYEYLRLTYEKLEDTGSAKLAQEKYEFLTKR